MADPTGRQMAFSGEFEHKLDGKFRLTVPASYRDQLEDGVVLVRGMDKCIDVYPPDEHERECEKADRASPGLQLQRTRQQILNAGVHTQLDPQGRITLPKGLRKWAGITQEVTVLGNRRTFRVWDPDRWDQFLDEEGTRYAEVDVDLDAAVPSHAAPADGA